MPGGGDVPRCGLGRHRSKTVAPECDHATDRGGLADDWIHRPGRLRPRIRDHVIIRQLEVRDNGLRRSGREHVDPRRGRCRVDFERGAPEVVVLAFLVPVHLHLDLAAADIEVPRCLHVGLIEGPIEDPKESPGDVVECDREAVEIEAEGN